MPNQVLPTQVTNVWGFLAVVAVVLVPTIPAILAFVQARRAASRAHETHIQLQAVEKATNGMKDQLVETTRQAALAAGIAQGKEIEKARVDADTLARVVILEHKDKEK